MGPNAGQSSRQTSFHEYAPCGWRWIISTFCAFPAFLLAVGSLAAAEPPQAASEPITFAQFMAKLGYRRIALKKTDSNHLAVKGRLSEDKCAFLVDSGFSVSAVHRSKAKKLPRMTGEDGKSVAVGRGWQKKELALVDKIDLDGVLFLNQPIVVRDLRTSGARTESMAAHPALAGPPSSMDEHDAILGLDFLRRSHAVLNLPEIALYVSEAPPPAKVTEVFDSSLRQGGLGTLQLTNVDDSFLTVGLSIGSGVASLLVDTGTPYSQIHTASAPRLKLPRDPTFAQALGVQRRRSDIFFARASVVRLGGWVSKDFPIAVADLGPWGVNDSPKLDGLLGLDILGNASAIIDFERNLLFVRQVANGSK